MDLTQEQLNNAILLNRHYAHFLSPRGVAACHPGWIDQSRSIVDRLGLPQTLDDRAFALGVAGWQRSNGLLVDGVLGTSTWCRMGNLPRVRLNGPRIFEPLLAQAQPLRATEAGSPMQMPGRGFMFVVVEVLPEVGSRNVVRKVAVVPRDFVLWPRNANGALSPAQQALNTNPARSQWLSASNRPIGAPTVGGRPLLIDMNKVRAAGGRIVTEAELVADLQRYLAQNPNMRVSIDRLVNTIRNLEGETLVQGPTPSGAVRPLSSTHTAHVRQGELLWNNHTSGQISRPQLQQGLASLDDSYRGARMVGRVGRVVSVVGVVFTVVDLGSATRSSVRERSVRPIAAEAVRQIGGWGGALAGAKIGGVAGAACGIETGPGAIVTGAIGAIIFGAAGYFGADWVADFIYED